jgi:hypothetical protein
MRTPRSSRALLIAIALVGLGASNTAHAGTLASGLSLTWNDCPGGATATSGITYACTGNTDTLQLICSVAVPQTITGVLGAELVIDIQSADPLSVPDWWRFDGSGTLGCRAGGFDAGYDFSANPGCTDAWLGNGFGGLQGFSVGPPDHTFMNQARLKVVAAVVSTNAVTLNPGITYGLIKLLINSNNTTGGSACGGCGTSECLVLQSAIILVQPGSGSNVTIGSAASPGSDWATWQGTAANCSAVPVRRSTWGAIKSLYR